MSRVSIAATRGLGGWRQWTGRLRHWRHAQLDRGRELEDFTADTATDYCPRCGASAGPGGITGAGCAFCVGKPIAWHRISRLGAYESSLAEAIKAMKFAGQWAWSGWFGRQLAAVLDEPPHADRLLVCPVPLHRFRQWSRGFNQAELIAEALAEARGWRLLPLLKRIRHTQPQSTLPPSGRHANVVRAFAAHPVDLAGYDVLLVDDVKTTGATLAGCARLLRKQGARTVHCVVVAVADPKGGGFRHL